MLAKEVRFSPYNKTCMTLIEALKHNGLEYDKDSKIDIGVIEFALLRCEFDKIILRHIGWYDEEGRSPSYKVLKGHGFVHTLDYYIVQDNVMEGFIILTDLNGTKYSDMQRNLRRRVEETILNIDLEECYVDDIEPLMKRYNEVLRNMD